MGSSDMQLKHMSTSDRMAVDLIDYWPLER